MPVSNLAAPEAVGKLTKAIDALPKNSAASKDYTSFGMIMDWKVEHQDQQMRVCLSVYQLGRYLFTLVQRRSGWFFTAAQDVSDEKSGKNCSEVMRLIR